MATLYKQDNSPYYWASFYYIDGSRRRRVRVSTREKNRKEAEKKAYELEQKYKSKEGAGDEKSKEILEKLKIGADLAITGDLNASKAQELLCSILEISTGETLQAYTIEEWCHYWLEMKQPLVKKSTYDFYRGALNGLLRFLGDRQTAKLQSLSKSELMRFRSSIIERGRTAKTANHYMTCIGSCLEQAKKDQLVTFNVAYGIDSLPEDDSKQRVPFTDEEVKSLIENASSNDWKGAILFGRFTGLRITDITNIRWGQIDFAENTLTIVPKKTSRKKKTLVIPLHPMVTEFLEALPCSDDNNEFLFSSLAERQAGGKKGVSTAFGEQMDKLGISKVVTTFNAQGQAQPALKSFHSLRHSFVSAMANANVSQELRKKLAGHSSDEMNDIYTSIEVDTLRGAIQSMKGV